MEEICVNEYVRLDRNQGIRKIEEIEDDIYILDDYIVDEYGEYTNYLRKSEKDMITKHSPNIIDVIEVGDYVNGYLVTYVCNKEPCSSGKYVDVDCDKPSEESYFFENQIKSVVTHEQFNSIKYEVI